MKPHVILHMLSSIEGRIVPKNWPGDVFSTLNTIYERVHRELDGDAWIVGRVTMAEFGEGEPKPIAASGPLPRHTWRAPGGEKGPFAVAIDASGKLHLNLNQANGDHIVCVLTESVPDTHLAELQRDGISYLFAGKSDLDLALAVDKLNTEFGVGRLLLEGGGGINGSFLAAGLIDEVSLLVCPIADGVAGPTIIDRPDGPDASALALQSVERVENDVVHLRYTVRRG